MSKPLILERHIAAPPATVYAYFTDAAKWVRWQGAAAMVEARPGGRFVVTMADGQQARGRFLELVPPELVIFTWGWADHPRVPPGSTTVSISLRGEESGTHLVLRHTGLPEDERLLHQQGWQHFLPRLAAVAEGQDPGSDATSGDN